MLPSNSITLYGSKRKDNETLCNRCEAGSPRDVLALIKESGFDCAILKKKFWVKEASPVPFHPTRQPFATACMKHNFPIVRLLLELGADPDADCCADTGHMTPRKKYGGNPQLQELFEGGKLWWKAEYPEEKKRMLQGALEHSILSGEASEALWLMMHGVRLASPTILASETFGNQSWAFQECVCDMGIPDDRLQEFRAWLKQNNANVSLLDFMDTLTRSNDDVGQEFTEKMLLSIDLLGADNVDTLIDHAFPLSVQIRILRCFINAYDASGHREFMENAIAALIREILYACMEV